MTFGLLLCILFFWGGDILSLILDWDKDDNKEDNKYG